MKERSQGFLWNRKARMMRRFKPMNLQASPVLSSSQYTFCRKLPIIPPLLLPRSYSILLDFLSLTHSLAHRSLPCSCST